MYSEENGDDGDIEWRETARWIKYEENLEFGANRWGKPRVPSLSFHDLLQLRDYIKNGLVLLDVEGSTFHSVAQGVIEKLIIENLLERENAALVLQTILLHITQAEAEVSRKSGREMSINSLEHFYYRQQKIPLETLEASTPKGSSSYDVTIFE